MEFTAIGNTVNAAARVESLTKALGQPIVFTLAVHDALKSPPRLVELPAQTVKGVDQPLKLFAPA